MAQRTVIHFFDDILKAIEAIDRFVVQMTYDDFTRDDKTIRAIEREFEILGEAVKQIPTSITEKYPERIVSLLSWRLPI